MLHGCGYTRCVSPLLGVHCLSERQLAAVLLRLCAASNQAAEVGLHSACISQSFLVNPTGGIKPDL